MNPSLEATDIDFVPDPKLTLECDHDEVCEWFGILPWGDRSGRRGLHAEDLEWMNVNRGKWLSRQDRNAIYHLVRCAGFKRYEITSDYKTLMARAWKEET